MDYLVNDHDLTHPPILITKFGTGSHTFTPHPDAVVTKIEAQAAGGAGGTTSNAAATSGCGLANGGNGGNFISVLFEEKLLLSSFSVTVGSKGVNPSSSGVGGSGGNIVIASITCYGGKGGQTTVGTTAALILNQNLNSNNNTNWSILGNPIILHNLLGQTAQSGYIPRAADHGFIKGGDGGDSFWGRGGRSDPAIYLGSRSGYRGIPRAGIGYGYGGAGAARGNRFVDRGLDGGEGVVIITEYF
jgi:hypothetical protein